MSLFMWLIIILIIYGAALVGLVLISRRYGIEDKNDFFLASRSIGPLIGFMTFSATLFSTFTLMGMPDLFRTDGIGAWIYLGVADVAMGFSVLYLGSSVRHAFEKSGSVSVSQQVRNRYGLTGALCYVASVFVFLVPYVAIQIRGIAFFLDAQVSVLFGPWFWAFLVFISIMLYSALGGLRAIIFNDVVQGVLLLGAVWTVALIVTGDAGGIAELFNNVNNVNPSLLSLPGPTGLFTIQFLIASFIAVQLQPFGWPHLTLRMAIIRSDKELRLMAVALAIFAFLIILPTISIGMYGAINYPNADVGQFLQSVLVGIQHPFLGALILVGLLAAAMSTADSLLFALGNEVAALPKKTNKSMKLLSRVSMLVFGIVAFIVALFSTEQIALLGRISIAGAGIVAPLVLSALFERSKTSMDVPFIVATLVLVFIATRVLGVVQLFGIRIDLLMILASGIYVAARTYRWEYKINKG